MHTKMIGQIPVDSGQIMIVDPCYIRNWDDKYEPDAPSDVLGYAGCCSASNNADLAGEVGGVGVVTGTGYGDGYYPVYATYTAEGRVARVTIDFECGD